MPLSIHGDVAARDGRRFSRGNVIFDEPLAQELLEDHPGLCSRVAFDADLAASEHAVHPEPAAPDAPTAPVPVPSRLVRTTEE